jgi:hypothetical protein
MDKIWVVKVSVYDSYEGESDMIISTHRTETGANQTAEELRKNKAIYALTGGMTDIYDDPDTVLGLVEDQSSEMAEDLRQEAAKPGASFIEAAMKVAQKHKDEGNINLAEVGVSSQDLKD